MFMNSTTCKETKTRVQPIPKQWENKLWGDGTSRNYVSPYECSGTPGPQINRPLWHNVPGLKHPCHYSLYNTFRLVQNDRDLSIQGHRVSGTIHLGDQGSKNICTGTHRSWASRHPTLITLMHCIPKRHYQWVLKGRGRVVPNCLVNQEKKNCIS